MKTIIESFKIEHTSLLSTNLLIHICVYYALGGVHLFPVHVPLICLSSVPVMANPFTPCRKACNCILLGFTFFWATQKQWKPFYANLSYNKTLFYTRNIKRKVLKKKKLKKSNHTFENSPNQ